MARPGLRLRGIDGLLLAVFLPLWLATVGLTLREGLRNGQAMLPFLVSSARGASDHPYVLRLWWGMRPETLPPLLPGDRILRVEDRDLTGVSAIGFHAAVFAATDGRRPIRIDVRRDGQSFEATSQLYPDPLLWWSDFPSWVGLGIVATFLLIRAPQWHLRRSFFLAAMFWCFYASGFFNAGPRFVYANSVLHDASTFGAVGLTLRNAFSAVEAASPIRGWRRFVPWLVAALMGSLDVWLSWFPVPLARFSLHDLYDLLFGMVMIATVAALAASGRQASALERRQGKWIFLGFLVALVPFGLTLIAEALGTHVDALLLGYVSTRLGLVAVPFGFLVAIVGSHFLDIDRILSAGASYTLLGILLAGSMLALAPSLASAVSHSAGLGPMAGQMLVGLGLAMVAVPLYRAIHARVESMFFRERQALQDGFRNLTATLSLADSLEDLIHAAGEQLDALLRPQAIAVYARSGDAFTPIFARGRAVPPAFAAASPLAAALRERGAPLAAGRWVRSAAASSDPFDRAALEALDVVVIVPVLRDGELVAFMCLGPKRSGDVYTNADLALLAAAADKVSGSLRRLDDGVVIREARELQDALRHYVPSAVAARLQAGGACEPGQREVTVLFVDLRDYVRFAEAREADEVFKTVSRYTESVSTIVHQRGGAVVEFHGDGLMAVFGALDPMPGKERAAVEAARETVAAVRSLGPPHAPLEVGVGVATGPAYVGDIRSADRRIWSVIGSTTNLAARLQAATRELDAAIALDPVTRAAAGAVAHDFSPVRDVAIRGRSERIDVHVLRRECRP